METHFPHFDEVFGQRARERLICDLRSLVAEGQSLLRANGDPASDHAGEMRARLSGALLAASTASANLEALGSGTLMAAGRHADRTIRAYPYRSLLVALGIGVLLGAR